MTFSKAVIDRLAESQRAVTRGQLADTKRRETIFKLWCQGMSQRAIAEHLTDASTAEGGQPISENVVQKIIRDIKRIERIKSNGSAA